MISEDIPHHGVPLGQKATGTVVHQDNVVSELHRVQDVLNAMQCN
jgi:hypothetical protein